ncbi:MarR family transcriptional regulator [bacterium]|nr:MarR family transcriptional regulator [bacterium]
MVEHYTKSLPYELELTSRVVHEASTSLFKQKNFPITHDEFVILDCLSIYPDIIQIELAKMILKGRAHTGRFLMALEEKGFIKRTPAKHGTKLIMKLSITPEGLNVYKKVSKEIDRHIDALHERLNMDKIRILIDMLHDIRKDAYENFDIDFK